MVSKKENRLNIGLASFFFLMSIVLFLDAYRSTEVMIQFIKGISGTIGLALGWLFSMKVKL